MLTFDEAELLTRARQLIEVMGRHPDKSAARLLLDTHFPAGKAYEVGELIHRLVRRTNRPVVLAFPMPGYVAIGHAGAELRLPDPRLDGLWIAYDVFLAGINAPASLHTNETWGKTPRAAANAVKRASRWVDHHCPVLASAMRQIAFSDDGRPTYNPAVPIAVNVFSAYSEPPQL